MNVTGTKVYTVVAIVKPGFAEDCDCIIANGTTEAIAREHLQEQLLDAYKEWDYNDDEDNTLTFDQWLNYYWMLREQNYWDHYGTDGKLLPLDVVCP